jgi:hypothetical protein
LVNYQHLLFMSTTFLFTTLCTSIQNFGAFRVQTRAHRHVVGTERRRADIARARAPAASASASARRPSRAPSPRARAPGRLEFLLCHASLPFAPYPAGSAPTEAARSTATSSPSPHRHHRPSRPYLKAAPSRAPHCRATRHGCHRRRALARVVPRATRPPRHRP